MIRTLACLLLTALPATADDAAWEARRAQCVGWMMAGAYPSGLAETSCQSDFALPSAFLFACARAQRTGFASETQRAACTLFFAEAARDAERGYVLR
jgi:hypothetical protein